MAKHLTVEIRADVAAFERAFTRVKASRWRRALIRIALWRTDRKARS